MGGHRRWRDNGRLTGPPGTVLVYVGRSRAARRAAREQIAALRPGAPVLLLANGPGARRRCRVFAASAGVRPHRAYLAFPSARAPAYLVEDHDASVRAFTRSVLIAPPRARMAPAVEAAVTIVRALDRPRLTSALAPGCGVLGWRS